MAPGSDDVVLPRPHTANYTASEPNSAPPEAAFTSTFGTLLPIADFLNEDAKVAYYSLPPTSASSGKATPERVLFIHGVGTPALGILPLARSLQSSFPSSHFVLFDNYGHGLSDTPYVPHTPRLFQCLIDTLLDELNWPFRSSGRILCRRLNSSRIHRLPSFAGAKSYAHRSSGSHALFGLSCRAPARRR